MGSATIAEMCLSLGIGLVWYGYCTLPFYNTIVNAVSIAGLSVAMEEGNMLFIISIGIQSLVFALLVGVVIYAFNQISYKTGWGA